MDLEPTQARDILGPLFKESLLCDVPVFGPDRVDVPAVVKEALELSTQCQDMVVDELAEGAAAPLDLHGAFTVAEQLKALRLYTQECLARPRSQGKDGIANKAALNQLDYEPQVQRERHERLLSEKMESRGLPREGHAVLDHIMLLRAKEKYLFHTATNQKVVADDPWLQDVWAWVAGKPTPFYGYPVC